MGDRRRKTEDGRPRTEDRGRETLSAMRKALKYEHEPQTTMMAGRRSLVAGHNPFVRRISYGR